MAHFFEIVFLHHYMDITRMVDDLRVTPTFDKEPEIRLPQRQPYFN